MIFGVELMRVLWGRRAIFDSPRAVFFTAPRTKRDGLTASKSGTKKSSDSWRTRFAIIDSAGSPQVKLPSRRSRRVKSCALREENTVRSAMKKSSGASPRKKRFPGFSEGNWQCRGVRWLMNSLWVIDFRPRGIICIVDKSSLTN